MQRTQQSKERQREGRALFLACYLMIGWGSSVSLAAADPAPVASESATGGSEASEPSAGEDLSLDSLLDLAEQDAAQLSQVRVADRAPSSLGTEVSTVSRQPSTVGKSPAAVFVVTNDMIRRSGALSIPEVLRMVPGLQVARVNSSQWAITARGFNGHFANKLLVQIDGRTVYTPAYAGVYWDVQNVVLADVERIEVIRGPGASVWGANAVNGVINIITKRASETQGVYGQAGGGSYEQGFATFRYGGQIGADIDYRVYGTWFDRGTGIPASGAPFDAWRIGQGGARVDWNPGRLDTDLITVQGDAYGGTSGTCDLQPSFVPPFSTISYFNTGLSGGNALVRWTHTISDDTEWSLQTYYDQFARNYAGLAANLRQDTFDVDYQFRFPVGDCHRFVCGAGYRSYRLSLVEPASLVFTSTEYDLNLFSYFVQDEITLSPDFSSLTLGCKFNHWTYAPFVYQPTARLLITPSDQQSLWGAVSRAVRTPSVGETQLVSITAAPDTSLGFPVYTQIRGNPSLRSEDVLAWEAGYRAQATETFSWDVATFFNQYHNLVVSQPGLPFFSPPGLFVPINMINGGQAETYGVELAAEYQWTEQLKLRGAYTFLEMFLHGAPGADAATQITEGSSPQNQFYLQASWNPRERVEIDLIGRYVDALDAFAIPSYFVGDARFAWHPNPCTELFLVGRGLFDNGHREFTGDTALGTPATGVRSEVFAGVSIWR